MVVAIQRLSLATGGDEIACRAGGFVRVIDNGLGEEGAHPCDGGGVAGVDEDDAVTGV
jgi:hypothetical protein